MFKKQLLSIKNDVIHIQQPRALINYFTSSLLSIAIKHSLVDGGIAVAVSDVAEDDVASHPVKK